MRLSRFACSLTLLCSTFVVIASGQLANGKLQIHHIDMGQGDSAVMITPGGTVVMFDIGRDVAKKKDCNSEIDYLDQLGVKTINYLFVSHYHYDHIDCVPEVLGRFPLQGYSYDRGTDQVEPKTATYRNYVKAVGSHRKTVKPGDQFKLESGATAVTLTVLSSSGWYKDSNDLKQVKTTDENDLSVSVLVSFGAFREEIGGDMSGEGTSTYQDVESYVAKSAVPLDVYKVHHHCSSHSSNTTWLQATTPTVAVISTGDGNVYRHPAEDCLSRLHEADIKRVYWTEKGAGAAPSVNDVIGGNIRIEVPLNAKEFTVTYADSATEAFNIKADIPDTTAEHNASSVAPSNAAVTEPKFAWSVNSDLYHYYDCPAVQSISKNNLRTGDNPPPGKKPSSCVTRRDNSGNN